jgi:hypothetical protein
MASRQLTEEDRKLVIKEARLAAVHDIQMVLAKLMEEQGQREPQLVRTAQLIVHYVGLRLGEIAQDKAGYPQQSHQLWS